jgi:hypothetical protein
MDDEAAMHELMPLLLGAVIGMQHARGTLLRRHVVALSITVAILASATSGELARSAWWMLSDFALVFMGALSVFATFAMHRRYRRRRQRKSLLAH